MSEEALGAIDGCPAGCSRDAGLPPAFDRIPDPTRASLLQRLKNWDDQQGWREFYDQYWRLIHATVLRAGFCQSDAEDLVQEVVLSIAKKMPQFNYDPAIGSFKSWLLVVTHSRIADRLRKRASRPPEARVASQDTGTDPIARIPDASAETFERHWESEWRAHVVALALERLKRKVKPDDFQIFDLAVLQDAAPKELAAALGVSLGRIYLVKHRVGRLLRSEIRRVRREHGPEELE